jgi:hypothetical protein
MIALTQTSFILYIVLFVHEMVEVQDSRRNCSVIESAYWLDDLPIEFLLSASIRNRKHQRNTK